MYIKAIHVSKNPEFEVWRAVLFEIESTVSAGADVSVEFCFLINKVIT